MKIVYAGDTAKFPIEIQSDGVVVSPTDTNKLTWVQIVVHSRIDADNIVGKYAFGGVPNAEWGDLVLDGDSDKLYLVLSKTDTAKVVNEELVMQITTCLVDTVIPGGEDISTGTAIFCKVKKKVE